ncbi:MAG: hypothetical protein PWP30_863 [Eubacteriaceae bacterium]|nr:hypothetical protein [Eubacteriaceae bacterium]
MAEMNLKQITDKLNAEFSGDNRKLVFWYDDNGDFAAEIDDLELTGAKVYHLETDNQFQTKHFLERVDTATSYLIYAPFPRPAVRDNHLEDTIRYSRVFHADRASLLMVDLGIDEKYKALLQKHLKFFAAQKRTQRFYDLEIEAYSKETIEVGLMSALCKSRTANFEAVVREVLMDDGEEVLKNNKILAEFEKYDLTAAFWRLCEKIFGYSDVTPNLEKFVITLFVTYTDRYFQGEIPTALGSFVSYKSGNIIAFLDSLMNNINYRDKYDCLSADIERKLKIATLFEGTDLALLLDCDNFAVFDRLIVAWLIQRLLAEDTGARLQDLTIPEICRDRSKKHFNSQFEGLYAVLEHAYQLILKAKYQSQSSFKAVVEHYLKEDYQIDYHYRKFYYHYDQLSDLTAFEKLRDLVENIYSNDYLEKITSGWNEVLTNEAFQNPMPLQRRFFDQAVSPIKDKLVVIISDALRYEVGQELFLKLQEDQKCTASLTCQLGLLPSYTRLGMAALLPHRQLTLSNDYRVLVDDCPADDLKQREAILKSRLPQSRCVQFDDVVLLKKAQLREIFTGMDVVYIYHNQIDARGDKANTENEVFTACQEAIDEIYGLIHRLSVNANTYRFMVTADHGFIYKRDKLQESDKIANGAGKEALVNRRFMIQQQPLIEDGIGSLALGPILGNDDSRMVFYPISANVFKVSGGGQNYVHGGSSPQEMLIPVIDIKTEKGRMESRPAQINLVSTIPKITTLKVFYDFMQTEAIGDGITETAYRLYFISEDNEKISTEINYRADKKEADDQQRIFRVTFTLKSRYYDKSKKYFLLAVDQQSGIEVMRHEVVIDMPFANDFGF